MSVDKSADNVTKLITETAKLCIPNTDVTIKPQEPNWMNSDIKRKIRQRKRQYRKAKRSNNPHVWKKFRKLRNEIVSLIRQEKQSIYERLSLKLKSDSLSSRDWWRTLKTFISPTTKSDIPPLYHIETDNLAVDDVDKATVLNTFLPSNHRLMILLITFPSTMQVLM